MRTLLSDLPTDIQEMIRALRKEAKDNREALEARARADAEAEQARLREAGQFKELAAQHEARVKELEPIAQRYTALTQLVQEQLEQEIKDWPAEVKTFDPGKDAPIEERLAWRNKSRPLMERLGQQARGAQPGMARNPPTGGQPTREDLIAANMADMRKERKRLL